MTEKLKDWNFLIETIEALELNQKPLVEKEHAPRGLKGRTLTAGYSFSTSYDKSRLYERWYADIFFGAACIWSSDATSQKGYPTKKEATLAMLKAYFTELEPVVFPEPKAKSTPSPTTTIDINFEPEAEEEHAHLLSQKTGLTIYQEGPEKIQLTFLSPINSQLKVSYKNIELVQAPAGEGKHFSENDKVSDSLAKVNAINLTTSQKQLLTDIIQGLAGLAITDQTLTWQVSTQTTVFNKEIPEVTLFASRLDQANPPYKKILRIYFSSNSRSSVFFHAIKRRIDLKPVTVEQVEAIFNNFKAND